jgi:phage shock protein A
LPPEAAERISGLTISEVMSRVRQLERKLAKELGLKERVEEKTIQLLSQRVTV